MNEIKRGKMNINFEETYDQETDIYYVSFKSGEPSYCVEIDDILLVEEGIFTGMPTGFRILNFKKNSVKQVKFLIRKFEKTITETGRELRNRLEQRKEQLEQSLEKVFA